MLVHTNHLKQCMSKTEHYLSFCYHFYFGKTNEGRGDRECLGEGEMNFLSSVVIKVLTEEGNT